MDEMLDKMRAQIKNYQIKRAIEKLQEDRILERDHEDSSREVFNLEQNEEQEECDGHHGDSDEDSSDDSTQKKIRINRQLDNQLMD